MNGHGVNPDAPALGPARYEGGDEAGVGGGGIVEGDADAAIGGGLSGAGERELGTCGGAVGSAGEGGDGGGDGGVGVGGSQVGLLRGHGAGPVAEDLGGAQANEVEFELQRVLDVLRVLEEHDVVEWAQAGGDECEGIGAAGVGVADKGAGDLE